MDSVRPGRLDAAREPGDPEASRRRRRQVAAAAEREQVAAVIDDLIAADDDFLEGVVTMLRHPDIRENLDDDDAVPWTDPDLLAGPFAHIVVDEAQELTDAEWQMLLLRCLPEPHHRRGPRPSRARLHRSRGSASSGSASTDHPVLPEHQLPHAEEVMVEAGPVIRAVLPDANVPTSIRTGVPVVHGSASTRGSILDSWLEAQRRRTPVSSAIPRSGRRPASSSSTPELSKA